MLMDLQKAKIVITNYHAFKLRERVQIAVPAKCCKVGGRS